MFNVGPEEDELLSFLMECFPEAPFEVLSEASNHSSTREEAIDYVLAMTINNELTEEPGDIDVVDDPDQTLLAQLVEVFPDVSMATLNGFVNRKGENEGLEELIDEVMVSESAFLCEPEADASWNIVKLKPRRMDFDQLGFISSQTQPSLTTQPRKGPFVYSKFCELEVPPVYDMDVDDLRDEIGDLLKERKELMRKASQEFARGGLTGTQSAGYFSAQAQKLKAQIDQLKLEASFRIFLRKYSGHFFVSVVLDVCSNPDPYSRTLDLHHLTLDEAIPLMDAFLDHHVNDDQSLPVQIITGAGRHSNPGVGPRIRPSVWRRLGFSNYRFSYDGHAIFTVYGRITNQ